MNDARPVSRVRRRDGRLARLAVALGLVASALLLPAADGPLLAADDDLAATAITRFRQVDARLYRGGQPDRAGYEALRALGVRTVINLRHEQDERRLVESLGFKYVAIPLAASPFAPNGRVPALAVSQFFAVVDDPANGPVFVHCRRGADRTGVAVGLYRIARQHWDAATAIDEARRIGMRWWYSGFKAQLREFARSPLEPVAVAGMPGGFLVSPAVALSTRP